MHVLLAAQLLVLGAGSPEVCARDPEGFCTDPVVRFALSYADTDPEIHINAGLGEVVAVELPVNVEIVGQLAVGNKACFETKRRDDSSGILIWPKAPEGAGRIDPTQLLGEKTNLQIRLDAGITVLVKVKISRPETSVQRLVLTFPEREQETTYVRRQLLAQTKKLEEEYQKRKEGLHEEVVVEARRSMARAVLERIHCNDLRERAERGLLIVTASQICRIGEVVYVKFEILNRARDLFDLESVKVIAADSGKQTELVAGVELGRGASGVQLGFDGSEKGIVYFIVAEGASASEYMLQVTENGGKKRVVTLDDIEF
jgi:hypothetical protein